jgi:hypothetical protein
MISFFEKLQRHGLLGIPRLIPINIRYYLGAPVKRYLRCSLGRYTPGLYDYFWQLGNPRERAAIQKFIETAPSGAMRERRRIPLSQVDQYLGLAGRIPKRAGFDFFGRS